MSDLDTNSYLSSINDYKNQILNLSTGYLKTLQTNYNIFNNNKGVTGDTSTCTACSSDIQTINLRIGNLQGADQEITSATTTLNTTISTLQNRLNQLQSTYPSTSFQQNKTASSLKNNLLEMYNSQYLLNVEIVIGIFLLFYGIYKLMFYKIIDFTSFFQTYIYGSNSTKSTK